MRPSALLLPILLLLPLAPASSAEAPIDWVLAEVVVPVETRRYDISFGVQGMGPEGALIVGRGYDLGGASRDIRITSYEGAQGGTSATSFVTGVGPVSTSIEVTRATSGAFGVGAALGVSGLAREGDTIRFLLFLPGASITSWFAALEIDGVTHPAAVTTGSGSTLVRIAEPGLGVGLETPEGMLPARAAGLTRVTHEVPAGVVGSLQLFQCEEGTECESSWTSPGGETSVVTHTRGPNWAGASGYPVFAGEAGAWTFSWRGASDSGIIAGYAPVGDAWRAW